jgi:hypothetical protein
MGPNETRDLICIGAADYGELYPATTHTSRKSAMPVWVARAWNWTPG